MNKSAGFNLSWSSPHSQQITNRKYMRWKQTQICTYLVITEGYGLCFACELQFSTGYPGLGVPVPLVIVYLISYLKFRWKTFCLAGNLRGLNPSLRLGSVQHCFLWLVIAVLFLFSPQQHNTNCLFNIWKLELTRKGVLQTQHSKLPQNCPIENKKVNILEQTTTQITTTPQETKLWNTPLKSWQLAHRKYTHNTTKQIKLQAKQHQILHKYAFGWVRMSALHRLHTATTFLPLNEAHNSVNQTIIQQEHVQHR